jgi:hypothetical protein
MGKYSGFGKVDLWRAKGLARGIPDPEASLLSDGMAFEAT